MSWDDVDNDKMVVREKFQMQKAHLRFRTFINTAYLLLVGIWIWKKVLI